MTMMTTMTGSRHVCRCVSSLLCVFFLYLVCFSFSFFYFIYSTNDYLVLTMCIGHYTTMKMTVPQSQKKGPRDALTFLGPYG